MPQGKIKVKTIMPKSGAKKNKSGKAFTSRANKPIQPKKHKFEDAHKLKRAITKTINKANEENMREQAEAKEKNLSTAQQAVVKHHEQMSATG